MPPKSSSGKEKGITEEDEVLQAVILADSFNKRFKPLTVGKPRCLLPICNATLLEWTFESLALAGVQEIFVICRSYADQVKTAIRDSKWSKPSSGIKIVPIVTAKETFSPGDAMRDIYTHQIITSDFVLVTGDLVSNVRIDEVVRVHKERRRTDKDAIMTMVVKESGAAHRTRSRGESGVYVLDPETSECLHYEPVVGFPPKTHVSIPREVLAEHPEVEIRNDFIDCSIDVCSVEVPSLFQDNFDYGDIRRDFVHGILTSDLLMKKIHCYIAKDGYAARVADTRSYDAVSKDILSRWTFPLVPDDNHPGGHSYEHLRGNKYIAKDNSVVLSRTCKIGNNTLIGSHTSISENASIHASVIGKRCTIGRGAVLRDAYIFDDTHVGAGCLVEGSIVGARVRLGDGVRVPTGCVIADGVVIGEGAKLRKFERISKKREARVNVEDDGSDGDDEEDEDSELEEVEAQQEEAPRILGKDTNALVWPHGSPEEEEELDERESYNNQRLMRIGDAASDLELSDAGSTTSASESESETESEFSASFSRSSSRTSFSGPSLSLPSADPTTETSAIHKLSSAAAESEFRSEVLQSLERAFAEGHSVENAAVELKTLRMASNVPLRRVREAVVGAIVDRIPLVQGDPAAQRAEIAKTVGRWGPLIDKIGGVDPVETIEVLQYHCAQAGPRQGLFAQVLVALYQDDLVEEEDIKAWHRSPAARGEGLGLKPGSAILEGVKKCWAVGEKLLDQFDGESEEEEEEESSVGEKSDLSESDGSEDSAPAKPPQPARASATPVAPAAAAAASAPRAPSYSTQGPAESESESDDDVTDSESGDGDAPGEPKSTPTAARNPPSGSAQAPAAVPATTPSAPGPAATSVPGQAGHAPVLGAPSTAALTHAKVKAEESEGSEEDSDESEEFVSGEES
ncbi:nucleotide-diphospho-sugar transferase [Fomes fomentarius]|nr:nucleotide-diphospho-sugar transferase [Fomes fomentarius]